MLESLTLDADVELIDMILQLLGGFLDTGRVLEEEQGQKSNIVVDHAIKVLHLDNLEVMQNHPNSQIKEKVLELIKEYFS
jgi:hypothetical protein